MSAMIDWLGRFGAGIVMIIGGLFAFVQWLDQRKRELRAGWFHRRNTMIEVSGCATRERQWL